MAEIKVERARPGIWPWVVGLLALALVVWAVTELFDRGAPEVPPTAVPQPSPTSPAPSPGSPERAPAGVAAPGPRLTFGAQPNGHPTRRNHS